MRTLSIAATATATALAADPDANGIGPILEPAAPDRRSVVSAIE